MTFWTLEPSGIPGDIVEPITFCEEHALMATNMAMAVTGDPGFGSMAEAYAVLNALTALGGVELGMTSSEEGECGECEHLANCPIHGAAAQIEESA